MTVNRLGENGKWAQSRHRSEAVTTPTAGAGRREKGPQSGLAVPSFTLAPQQGQAQNMTFLLCAEAPPRGRRRAPRLYSCSLGAKKGTFPLMPYGPSTRR